MDRVQLSQGCGATLRRQFTFYHHVFMNSWYSFYQPQMNERLSWPRTHPVVVLLGTQRLGNQFLNHQAIAPCMSPNKQKPQKRKLYLLCYNTLQYNGFTERTLYTAISTISFKYQTTFISTFILYIYYVCFSKLPWNCLFPWLTFF